MVRLRSGRSVSVRMKPLRSSRTPSSQDLAGTAPMKPKSPAQDTLSRVPPILFASTIESRWSPPSTPTTSVPKCNSIRL